MQFISVFELQKIIGTTIDLSDSVGQKEAMDRIKEKNVSGSMVIGQKSYTLEEINTFISSLDPEKLIFLSWIEQHLSLKELLLGKIPKIEFQDTFKWKKHTLFPSFSHYISTFLQQVLIQFTKEESLNKKRILFSYLELLPSEDKIFIEQALFKPIKERITLLKDQIGKTDNEKELIAHLSYICNEEMISIVNHLSRSSYASKLWYVDQLLWVIKQKSCTVRLANWILKQLEQIELNPEHQEKVTELKEDLRSGKIKIQNQNLTKKSSMTFKKSFSLFFLIVLFGVVIWIIWKKPFSSSEEELFSTSTSFEQFTKDERKQLDSLLREIQQSHSPINDQIDPINPIFGNGISLNLRDVLKNSRMEKLYNDLLLDADLQENNRIDTCSKFQPKIAKETLYPGVTKALDKKGEHSVFFKNESDYSVYLLVFDNHKNGLISSVLMQKNDVLELKLNSNDHLLFIAGNDLGKFIPPVGIHELPSSDFDHHYCTTDANYLESLSNIYILEHPQKGKNKLLFSGDKNGYFSVVDLYGILELK